MSCTRSLKFISIFSFRNFIWHSPNLLFLTLVYCLVKDFLLAINLRLAYETRLNLYAKPSKSFAPNVKHCSNLAFLSIKFMPLKLFKSNMKTESIKIWDHRRFITKSTGENSQCRSWSVGITTHVALRPFEWWAPSFGHTSYNVQSAYIPSFNTNCTLLYARIQIRFNFWKWLSNCTEYATDGFIRDYEESTVTFPSPRMIAENSVFHLHIARTVVFQTGHSKSQSEAEMFNTGSFKSWAGCLFW